MKILALIILLASPVLAGGKRYGHDDRFVDAEFQNVYRKIGAISVDVDPLSVSSATITNLTASRSTSTYVNVATLTVTSAIFLPSTQSYTPTFGSGWGTTSNQTIRYRVIGGWMELWGVFQLGSVAAATGSITLPSGYVLDAANLGGNTRDAVGMIYRLGGAAGALFSGSSRAGILVYDGVNEDRIFFSYSNNGSNEFVVTNVNDIFTDSDFASFKASFPVIPQ